MEQTIAGIIGFLIGGGAVLLGFVLGLRAARGDPASARRAAHPHRREKDTDGSAADPGVQERRELEDEQRAFRLLTGYNADIAYGKESL